MRRMTPLAVLAVVLVLAGCSDDPAASPATPATVLVGGLPESLPSSATSVPDTAPEPDETSLPSTAPTAPPTTAPARTSFAAELGQLGGDGEPAPSRIVTDDTRRLRLAVPSTWAEQRTAPATDGDGAEVPSLSVAPNMTGFLDGYTTPGLTALVVTDDPGDALDTYEFHEDCVGGGREPFRGEDLAGTYEVWRECGGTGSDIVTIAVRPDDADQTVLVLAQLVDPADAAALDHALATLSLRD
jgi:hypothetical protein